MRQVFVPTHWIDHQKKEIVLADDPFHHVVHVMRKMPGQSVTIFDGKGGTYSARIREISGRQAILEILSETRDGSLDKPFEVTLASAILKGKRMHWLIQKATEVGVHAIVPLVTRRTVALPKAHGADKTAKWEKVAIEASKQCGRTWVPDIHPPVALEDFFAQTANYDAKLLAWEGNSEEGRPLSLRAWAAQAVGPLKNLGRKANVLVVVGPEGGFDAREIQQARQHGFTLFGMGENILRSETAAVIAGALVLYELENS